MEIHLYLHGRTGPRAAGSLFEIRKGDYDISDISCYGTSWDEGAGETLYQSVFEADKKQTKGNQIAGTIQVKEDGYFITTIPI